MGQPEARRLRRLSEELEESGLPPIASRWWRATLLEEVDQALRPVVHERRIPSSGTVLEPTADPATWAQGTQLEIARSPVLHGSLAASRLFVDGLSSWLVRRADSTGHEWMTFDRPAGSERDLVVLADVLGATVVQRHPTGVVRIVGLFGVLRWEGLTWHHEPPIGPWVDELTAGDFVGQREVVEAMLRLAVHDLGSLGIGALLIYRPADDDGVVAEHRLPEPPPLRIGRASHIAPLRHALAQVDGAAVFDTGGVLRSLGVRLVPSAEAESAVPALGGTRHTSALRYSRDDPSATVIAVSEDGPVSVMRNGTVLDRPLARAGDGGPS
jgi:sensor domain DACNK-containing protein/DisA checkpoint controller-like protein